MFIGGLNWDTTDGTSFYVTARCGDVRVVLKEPFIVFIRVTQEVFHAVWQGRSLHDHAGRRWPFAVLCVPYIRRSSVRQRSNGSGAFS